MDAVILNAPRGDFQELSRTPKGRLFRKQILKYGTWTHPSIPGASLVIDRGVADSLKANFSAGVCDIVQVPVVDDANRHSEDPFRNIGEVVDLEVTEDGVYAHIDVRKPEAAEVMGKTLIGASAMMHMNYRDTRTGRHVGPTLLHTAVTNRPYITGLKDYEEIVRASADGLGDKFPVLLTNHEETRTMLTKDEMIAALREDHGIDVEALQASAGSAAPAALSGDMVDALTSVLTNAGVALSSTDPTDISMVDIAGGVVELANANVALSNKIDALEAERTAERTKAAEAEVDGLVEKGRILPKQRDAMLRLSLTDRETFEALLPESSLVSLSEDGITVHEEPDNDDRDAFEADIARLSDIANSLGRS